jgi:hypothetical protein
MLDPRSLVLGAVTLGVETFGVVTDGVLTFGTVTVGTVTFGVVGVVTVGVVAFGTGTGTVTDCDGTVAVSPLVPTEGTLRAGAVAAAISAARHANVETAAIRLPWAIAPLLLPRSREFQTPSRGCPDGAGPLEARR